MKFIKFNCLPKQLDIFPFLISEAIVEDEELLLDAFKSNTEIFSYIENPTLQFFLKAIKINVFAFNYIKPSTFTHFFNTLLESLNISEINSNNISLLNHEQLLIALKHDLQLFKLIDNPSNLFIKNAVEINNDIISLLNHNQLSISDNTSTYIKTIIWFDLFNTNKFKSIINEHILNFILDNNIEFKLYMFIFIKNPSKNIIFKICYRFTGCIDIITKHLINNNYFPFNTKHIEDDIYTSYQENLQFRNFLSRYHTTIR